MSAYTIIAILGSIPMLLLAYVARPDNGNYHYSFLFLIPMLWGVGLARKPLHLHPLHFAMFAVALVLHDLGALGYYTREFGGLAFDTYVHFYFGLSGGLMLERAFRLGVRLEGWQLRIGAVMFLLGLGAIHEIMEVASTLALGPKMGMYKMASADELDTQKDLLCNLVGGVTAIALVALHSRTRLQQ
ncbi:MAG TPA: DUF2238 domain-containing protein [Planctomycetota bacterium]|nr:DUF2238 domain-containing protein [Planctomycetota bacterium]